MLPPVRTISGSSGSYQSSSSVSASAHLTGEAIYPGHAADADRDVNPNHSGKLNILLLNGRDGVPEGLSMIADALGRAVNLPRREGETPSAYVTRLALALSVMPALLKADAEHELMKILRGVRLQLVIDAFLNPAGPEAARIVALLEMAGTTERDLAALTVLTSYRQHDGADPQPSPALMQGPPPAPTPGVTALPDTAAAPSAPVPPSPPAESGEAAFAVLSDAPAAEAAPPEGAPSPDVERLDRQAALPFTGEADDDLGLIRYHKTDNIFSRTSVPEFEPEASAEAPAEATPVRRAMADLDPARLEERAGARTGRGLPTPTDARGLQTVLNAAFAAGDSEDPLVQAKAAMDLLAGEAADAASTSGRLTPTPRREFASRPFADLARPVPRPLPRPEDLPPIFGLKGWPEDIFIEPGILPASRITEAVLAATLVPHAGPEPDQADPAYLLRGRGIAANDIGEHSKAALEAAEQQLIRTADQAAGLSADRRLDPPVRAERSAADQLLASALQLGIDPRQAIGFASLPNPIADERDEGALPRRGHRASDESEGEGEEGQQGEERAEDPAISDAEEAAPEIELPANSSAEAPIAADAGDPAYDYYQRMADWS